MRRLEHVEGGIDAVDGSRPEGEHHAALGAEALHEGCGRETGLTGDFGEGKPCRAEARHGTLGGQEDVFVGDRSRARSHARQIVNEQLLSSAVSK